jgi:hypothetical protein
MRVDLANIAHRPQGLFIQQVFMKHLLHAWYSQLQRRVTMNSPALDSLQSNEKHI